VLVSAAPAAAPDFTALRLIPYTPPKPAPAFALPDLAGNTVSLADLKGHLVLVFFWATW
jgi:cytochrome oxidase Cu insertion factor (SCO1/SenC/PrrC family)